MWTLYFFLSFWIIPLLTPSWFGWPFFLLNRNFEIIQIFNVCQLKFLVRIIFFFFFFFFCFTDLRSHSIAIRLADEIAAKGRPSKNKFTLLSFVVYRKSSRIKTNNKFFSTSKVSHHPLPTAVDGCPLTVTYKEWYFYFFFFVEMRNQQRSFKKKWTVRHWKRTVLNKPPSF